MKILSINNFTTKLLSKRLKGTKKILIDNFIYRKTVFHMKIWSITNLTTKLLSIDCSEMKENL